MTTQTFIFLSEQSESDSEDDVYDMTQLLTNQGHAKKKVKYKKEITQDNESSNNNNEYSVKRVTQLNGKTLPCNVPTKTNKSKSPSTQINSVQDGIKQLEKHELAKKRRTIIYQLMVTSAIAMLHGLSIIPGFWNSVLLNIYDLTTQTVCIWIILVFFNVSCIVAPSVIHRFSFKMILSTGCFAASLFTAARFFPRLYTIIPASIIVGITMGPFYVTIFKHVSDLSSQYEGYQGPGYRATVYTFTAVCFGWISCSPVWLAIFHTIIYNLVGGEGGDVSALTSIDCGFSFLWDWTSTTGIARGLSPEVHRIQALLGSCLLCTLGGILLIVVALEDNKVPDHRPYASTGDRLKEDTRGNLNMLSDSNHLLMFPIFFGAGAMEIYTYTLFGQAFVSCYFGSDSMYYVLLSMSITACLTAIAAGALYKRVSSVKVIIPTYSLTLILLLVLSFGGYMPYPLYFIMTGLLAIVNYVLISQVTAMVLLCCASKVEVSYSLLQCGRGLAFLLTFILVRYQGDNSTLTIAILGSISIAFFCHVILEIRLRLLEKQDKLGSDKSGAYVLLNQTPWLPEVDPTSVKKDRTMSLLTRLPSKEDEENCNQQ